MTIAYENGPEDAAAAQVFRIFGLPATRKVMRWARIVMAISTALFALTISFAMISEGRFFGFPLMPVLFLLSYNFLFSPHFYQFTFYQQAKRKKIPDQMRVDLGRRTVSIRPDGLFVSLDKLSDTLVKWEAIREVKVEKKHIFVVWGGIQIVTIPRRVFADATQEAAFLLEIERHRLGLFAAPAMIPMTLASVPTATTTTVVTDSNAPWWTSQTPLTEEKPTININRGG